MSWWQRLAKWAAGKGLEWIGTKIQKAPEKPQPRKPRRSSRPLH